MSKGSEMSIHYKFLFSPNNSGTTVMSQYLAANLVDSYLPPFGNNEGQMAPGVKGMMRGKSWKKSISASDWKIIKKEWDNLAKNDGKTVFIESSPPNMMRVSEMLNCFENCEYVFSVSTPYSYIASQTFAILKNVDPAKGSPSFSKKIDRFARIWIDNAKVQRANIENFDGASRRITYEEFCANPKRLLELMGARASDFGDRVLSVEGKKNSRVREIVDMLPKHLGFLGLEGISQINSILTDYQDLLEWFGYSQLSMIDINSILTHNIVLALDGQRRRIFVEGLMRKS